ncbi:MAG: hypothetical protein H8E44_07240 [Planctomycetes bacterium]|nr:hypothetical protein [Planctomycetota bacterium]
MATHKLTIAVEGSGISLTRDISETGTGVVLIDGETVADSVTDQVCNIDLDVSAVKSFYIVSDQNITVETNAVDATGGNTLSLIAGEPYIWHVSSLDSFLLTQDVTIAYLTNASGSTATVYCVACYDASP